jgi:dTDP-4-amino-4,6-dideoxygalactose transaminase
LEQLKKFSEIDHNRKQNYLTISGFFSEHPRVRTADVLLQADPCWFGCPIICDSREAKGSLVAHLEAHKIQTRPYFSGNILYHPGYKHLGNPKDYPRACEVMDKVFFLGVYPGYTQEVLDYIGKVVGKWTQNSQS